MEPRMDAERLAALLDGRVDPRERAAALERLAASDEELGVAADAAAVLRELEEEDARSGVIPLRPRAARPAGVRPWMAVAAAIAAMALIPLGVWLAGPGAPPAPVAVVAMLESPSSGLPAGWDVRPWPVVRGEGLGARAGRLGAFLADLDLAARTNDPAVALLAARVAAMLDDVPGAGTTADLYRGISARAGAPYAELAPSLRSGEDAIAGLVDRELLAIGAWAEAARFAAMRGDAEFFRARGSRRMMEVAEARFAEDAGVRSALERMRAGLEGDAPDWDGAQAGAEGVLAGLP